MAYDDGYCIYLKLACGDSGVLSIDVTCNSTGETYSVTGTEETTLAFDKYIDGTVDDESSSRYGQYYCKFTFAPKYLGAYKFDYWGQDGTIVSSWSQHSTMTLTLCWTGSGNITSEHTYAVYSKLGLPSLNGTITLGSEGIKSVTVDWYGENGSGAYTELNTVSVNWTDYPSGSATVSIPRIHDDASLAYSTTYKMTLTATLEDGYKFDGYEASNGNTNTSLSWILSYTENYSSYYPDEDLTMSSIVVNASPITCAVTVSYYNIDNAADVYYTLNMITHDTGGGILGSYFVNYPDTITAEVPYGGSILVFGRFTSVNYDPYWRMVNAVQWTDSGVTYSADEMLELEVTDNLYILFGVYEGASSGGVNIYTSSGWVSATPYIYTGGWKPATPYIYKDGAWTQCSG